MGEGHPDPRRQPAGERPGLLPIRSPCGGVDDIKPWPGEISPRVVARLFGTPSMGVISAVKVRNGGWRAPTISQRQGCLPRGGICKKAEANARAKGHELDLRQG